MKINKTILTLLAITYVFLNSCSGDELEIKGRVHVADFNGFKCWYIVDENNGFHYELVSPDQFLLQDGRRAILKAKRSKADTICKVGDRIEIISYQVSS
jgi:hypothetical protein